MSIKVGETVVMSKEVIKRTNHSEFVKNFKGIVKAVFGATCDVETANGTRSVPVKNLVALKEVFDSRTQKTSKLIIEL